MTNYKHKKKKINNRPITFNDVNKYGLGGILTGLASSALGMISDIKSDPKLKNTEEVDNSIKKQQTFQSLASTEEELLAEMTGASKIRESYDSSEFMRSDKEATLDIVGKGLSGFTSGITAAPGLGGLFLGIGQGLMGAFGASKKRKKEKEAAEAFAAEASRKAQMANLAQANTFLSKGNALDEQADARALAAYAAYGGNINAPKFPDFPSEITEFNTGGSHEENPYDGIPQGIAPDGLPNLVEEGEVKYDNYIFSDRLMLNKNDKKKYKFLKGKTYADAAKAIKKDLGIDERPNDLIAKTDLEEQLNILSMLQEGERAKKGLKGENRMLYSYGGHTFAGDYGQNYFFDADEAAQAGIDWAPEPMPGLLGELRRPKSRYATPSKNAFDFSVFDDDEVLSDYDEQGIEDPDLIMTRAGFEEQPGLLSQVPSLEKINPEDPLHNPSVQSIQKQIQKASNPEPVVSSLKSTEKSSTASSVLKYLPAIASGLGLLHQMANKPDYSHLNELDTYEETFTPVTFTPISQRLTYKPFDTNYYGNKLAAQAGATRAAIREQNASNPLAATSALLVADYNDHSQLGDLYRKAEEYNLSQKEKVNTFNRVTDSANAEMSLKAQTANQAIKDKIESRRLKRKMAVAEAKQNIDDAYSAVTSANLNTFIDNLSAIGKENTAVGMAAAKMLGEGKLTPEQAKQYVEMFPALGDMLGYKTSSTTKTRTRKRKKGYTIN